MREHFLPFAFPVGALGGLSSSLFAENTAGKSVTVISPGTELCSSGNVKVVPADPLPAGLPDRWDLWFQTGFCQLTFPEAYTAPTTLPGAIEAMYTGDAERQSEHAVGSFERLLEFVDRYAPDWSAARYFTQRFDRLIRAIPPDAVVNWQSFFFEPAITDHADSLRARGVKQTFHLHEALPDSLSRSAWGRSFLAAMSKIDYIFVHTDEFARRLAAQLAQCGLPIPEIRRFDLPVDHEMIRRSLDTVCPGSYTKTIPGFFGLRPEQQAFIHEVFRTLGTVPHRFLCLDRIDPVKGCDVVYMGVRSFLREQLANYGTVDGLRDNFRFFFLQHDPTAAESPTSAMNHLYGRYVRTLFENLQAEFPGVVWRADALQNQQRIALFPLMLGTHGITGGTTEGLNLGIMEIAKVNERQDATIVCGAGAGFAMQTREHGNEHLAFFPHPGERGRFSYQLPPHHKDKG